MPRSLTPEEADKQLRRAYGDDRLPGLGLERDALGNAGQRRLRRRDGLCAVCGERTYTRPGNAATCLVHRVYGGVPKRADLVAMAADLEGALGQVRAALALLDEVEEAEA